MHSVGVNSLPRVHYSNLSTTCSFPPKLHCSSLLGCQYVSFLRILPSSRHGIQSVPDHKYISHRTREISISPDTHSAFCLLPALFDYKLRDYREARDCAPTRYVTLSTLSVIIIAIPSALCAPSFLVSHVRVVTIQLKKVIEGLSLERRLRPEEVL